MSDIYTVAALRDLVMSFGSGCEEGKKTFLKDNDLLPKPVRKTKTYVLTFEWDEGTGEFHEGSCRNVAKAIARGLKEDTNGYQRIQENKNLVITVSNP